ncbi:hypothetical protein BH017_02575 [Salmonella enterica]|nr:hypothetical protein [Salmonella enterica]ECO0015981.1 hypothetical protein [Salmonella enterica subsp. enterica serovar Heidelberg]ECO0017233.1 hypothetical protein [Salmonella enterica subsp. enterica serovar Heidelberg]
MVRVCFAPDKTGVDAMEKHYAIMLARFLSKTELSGWLGCWGGFERQSRNAEHIHKLHIRVPDMEPWGAHVRQPDRKSDSFLLYSSHYMYEDYFLYLGILHPDAHKRIDSILPNIISFTENNFQSRNEKELRELICISA